MSLSSKSRKRSNHSSLKKKGAGGALALAGALLILPYEGEVRNKDGIHSVYLDAVGIPTACYGQTDKDHYGNKIKMGMTYTDEECMDMFVYTATKFEAELDKTFGPYYQNDYQKAAILSFAYNVGVHAAKTSTMGKLMVSGRQEEACEQLSRWVYAGKKKLPGLVTRREEEKAFCLGTDEIKYKVEMIIGYIDTKPEITIAVVEDKQEEIVITPEVEEPKVEEVVEPKKNLFGRVRDFFKNLF